MSLIWRVFQICGEVIPKKLDLSRIRTRPIRSLLWVSIRHFLRKLGHVINLACITDLLPGAYEEARPDADTDEAYSLPPGAEFVGGKSFSMAAAYNDETAGDQEAPEPFYQSSLPTQEPQGSNGKSFCRTISVA